jgi:hypothetical protein
LNIAEKTTRRGSQFTRPQKEEVASQTNEMSSAAAGGSGAGAVAWTGGNELRRKATYSAYALAPFAVPMMIVMGCVYSFGTRRMPLFSGGFGADAVFWMAMVAGFFGLTLAAMYIPWPEVSGDGSGDGEDDEDAGNNNGLSL